jgi:catechol 2,3-dioxygenase-like lactoylglutathione lyase family enzyme
MPYIVNHIHIKSKDPKVTAEWFVSAFNVKIVSDTLRSFGDRFVITETEGGLKINISNERTGETLGPADADAHYGIEHFGFDTVDIKKDIDRLIGLGAELKEGPIDVPDGPIIAFISAPGDIRIELIESR